MKRIDLSEPATKKDLNELRDNLGEFKDETRNEFVELRKENKQYRDQVLNRLDDVMKQLEDMREDKELGIYQTRELREDVDDLKKRVTKLEHTHHKS